MTLFLLFWLFHQIVAKFWVRNCAYHKQCLTYASNNNNYYCKIEAYGMKTEGGKKAILVCLHRISIIFRIMTATIFLKKWGSLYCWKFGPIWQSNPNTKNCQLLVNFYSRGSVTHVDSSNSCVIMLKVLFLCELKTACVYLLLKACT